MSVLKSLISTVITAIPTTTVVKTIEPIPRVEKLKKDIKDAFKDFGEDVKSAAEAKKKRRQARKTTKIIGDIKVNNKKLNKLIGTTTVTGVSTTTSSITANLNAKNIQNRVDQKSLSTYVNSMTDEELVAALEKFDLLDSQDDTKTNIK